MNEEIRIKLTQMVKEIAEYEEIPNIIGEKVNLSDEYMFDSLMIIELISNIEIEYGFEFDFELLDIDKIYFFDELVSIVENRIK